MVKKFFLLVVVLAFALFLPIISATTTLNDTSITTTGNLTLGQKITFTFGEIIDNIVDGYLRVTGNLNMSNHSISDTNYIDFSTNPGTLSHSDGRLSWDVDDGTLELDLEGGNVNLQIGQEEVVRVKAGEAISNGDVVFVNSASGQRPIARKASNNDSATWQILGVATEDIGINQPGYITTSGLVRELDTSSFSDGDTAYLGTNGQLATIPPSGISSGTIIVGQIIYSHANEGILLVEKNPFALSDNYNGTLRYTIENTNNSASSTVGFTAINDAEHRITFGLGSSTHSLFQDKLAIYSSGYGDSLYVVDGNKSHIWYTDPTDSHDYSSINYPQMELDANGNLNISGNYTNNANIGITGNYTNGNCWTAYSGGIVYATNCTAL